MRTYLGAVALAAALIAGGPAVAALADGGFESQADTVAGFCYFSLANCPAGDWSGNGGLQNETNGAWPGTATPDGDSYGFIQSGSFIEQTFTAGDSGIFALSWLEAGRPNGTFTGNQTYDVLLNGASLGSFATISFQPFTAEATGTFNLFAGQSYTLRFQGTNLNGGDNTAFIDQVALNYVAPLPTGPGVPEPGAWALMILGFGATGAAIRRRRRPSRGQIFAAAPA